MLRARDTLWRELQMKMVIFSLVTGIAVGGLFKFLKFPIPAPNNLAGIMGVVGIWLGMIIVTWITR
jgi:XapX domain-containing protein